MKPYLVIFLFLIAFIGISGFSFLGMIHDGTVDHNDCFATAMAGALCPDKLNSLSFFSFHVNALKNFSGALLNMNLTIAILLIIASALVFLFNAQHFKYFPLRAPVSYLYRVRFLELFAVQPARAVLFWLALREHSPTLLIRRQR